MSANPHLQYRPDIDGLRAVAIGSVVVYHAFPGWASGGFVGVDVFFVISGYLITSLILKGLFMEGSGQGSFSFWTFYANRVRRIFPALVLVLTACLALGWFLMLADEYKQLGKQVAAGAAFVENISLWSEAGYFDTLAELKPLLHLWSLGIEEQFYLAWPILLAVAVRRRLNLLVFILSIGLVSFVGNVVVVGGNASAAFYSPMTRMWELMSGGALAYFHAFESAGYERSADRRASLLPLLSMRAVNNGKSFAGLLLILGTVLLLDKTAAFPGWWALLPTIGAYLLISAGAEAWINRHILATRSFVFVGLISYPLYLWHWPLLAFARILKGSPGPMLRGSAIAAAFVLSCLTYWLIERKIRIRKRRATAIGLAGALILVGCAGYNVFDRDGMEFRLKDSESERMKFNVTLLYQTQCRRDFKFAGDSFCMRGSEASPVTAALIGDSHALNLYPGLGNHLAGRGENLVLFGTGGGIPLLGVERIVDGRATASYSRLYGSIFDYVVNDTRIKTVILMNRAVWRNGEADALKYELDPANRDSLDVYGEAMARTLSVLLAAHKQVVFVIDNPMMDFDPGTCVPRPSNVSPVKTPCALPREKYDTESRLYRKKIEETLKGFPEVKRWDLSKSLCDAEYCWAVRDGKMLYARDGHHMTFEASYWLADRFAPE